MTKAVDSSVPRITYDELGGLKREVQKIREMVELPMRHPELFEKIGVEAPKGVLTIWSTRNWKNITWQKQ